MKITVSPGEIGAIQEFWRDRREAVYCVYTIRILGQLIYVGQTNNLTARVFEHVSGSHSPEIRAAVEFAKERGFEIEIQNVYTSISRERVEARERALIEREHEAGNDWLANQEARFPSFHDRLARLAESKLTKSELVYDDAELRAELAELRGASGN